MSFLEGMVPVSNPRRLHLTCWTHSLSPAKVSYLLGRMSSSVTPLGRTTSRGGMLLFSCSVAHFFGGDVCGLRSSSGHFWLRPGSLFGVEAAWGISIWRSESLSCDITTAATSSGSGSGRVLSRSFSPCSPSLLHLAPHLHPGYHLTIVRWAWCIWFSRGPAATPQALFQL